MLLLSGKVLTDPQGVMIQLTPSLALLLVHDLLLSKKGLAANPSHVLTLAITKHKARLTAELTKARLRRGCPSIDALRNFLNNESGHDRPVQNDVNDIDSSKSEYADGQWPHPRWVRINTLKTDLDEQLATTFVGYRKMETVEQLLQQTSSINSNERLYVDKHIPNLLALPPDASLSSTAAYSKGLIIFQDKASCFPAYLLDPNQKDGHCLDACAAPGNKTTHLAAILKTLNVGTHQQKIFACERDTARAMTLRSMIKVAGADENVTIKVGQDFLKLKPEMAPWDEVGSLLLDPSCSGSGIVGREGMTPIILPRKDVGESMDSKTKKRKRKDMTKRENPTSNSHVPPALSVQDENVLQSRLEALSAFQLKLILHAFQFPRARKIAYSTCSIYTQENEEVVCKALSSSIAKYQKWRILRRNEQVSGMKAWDIRGVVSACQENLIKATQSIEEVAEACIRCRKGTNEGTQGFFVATFVRDDHIEPTVHPLYLEAPESHPQELDAEDEWQGFQ